MKTLFGNAMLVSPKSQQRVGMLRLNAKWNTRVIIQMLTLIWRNTKYFAANIIQPLVTRLFYFTP